MGHVLARVAWRGESGCHLPACLRTAATGRGASSAVRGFVLFAFRSASLADSGANRAELGGETAVAGHELCRQSTDGSAVPIEADAFAHHFEVGLAETS